MVNVKKDKFKPQFITYRPIKDEKDDEGENFLRRLLNYGFLNINSSCTVDDMVDSFIVIILQVIDCHAPVKSILLKHKSSSWVTPIRNLFY